MIPRSRAAYLLICTMLLATIFSFRNKPGGEGFEIYLDNKLVVQRHGSQMNNPLVLNLEPADAAKQLTVKYWHCGKAAKNRTITIKDEKDRVLKTWAYSDDTRTSNDMKCGVREIMKLEKPSVTSFKLYYSSSELPNGRMLAALHFNSKAVASR